MCMLTQCVRMTGNFFFNLKKKNLLIASKAPQCGVGAIGVGAVVLVEAQVGAALAWYSRRSACNTPPQPGTTPVVTFPQGLGAWGLGDLAEAGWG